MTSAALNDPDYREPRNERFSIQIAPLNEANEEDAVEFVGTYSDAVEQAQEMVKAAGYEVARTEVVKL